jgi:hypothetical protein
MNAPSVLFLIERNAVYRYLGSVVEAALAQGWDVTLLHDYSLLQDGAKAYQFPSVDSAPRFSAGQPQSIVHHGASELGRLLRESSADCVVASRGPIDYLAAEEIDQVSMPWIAVQEHFDFASFGINRITTSSLNCVYSPYWLELVAELYAAPPARDELATQVRAISTVTGCTQSDGLHQIDRTVLRERWGIPKDQPVVVYVPSNHGPALYFRVIHGRRFLTRAAHILYAKRWRLLPYAWRNFSDKALVSAVRAFCDHNGAYLLVKNRQKNPVPEYLSAAADRVITDETEYPAGIFAPLSIADLCITAYQSDSVYDAAAAGVPVLSLYPDSMHRWPAIQRLDIQFASSPEDVHYTPKPGGPFNAPGFAYTTSLLDGIKHLPSMRFADFPLNPTALQEYVTRYLGFADGHCGERVITAVEELLTNRSPAERGASGNSNGS